MDKTDSRAASGKTTGGESASPEPLFPPSEKKRVLENIFSLGLLQGANYLLPLVTVPYLVRVLGPEKFGLVSFAQAFAAYFIILTDYGFNLSATREIAVHRDDDAKVSEIFFSVLILKLLLTLAGILILIPIIFLVPKFSGDWLLYLFSYGVVLGNILFPIWYFQGIEKMKYIAYLNISAKALAAGAIFLFIRGIEDYIYVPLFTAAGYLVAGIIGLSIALRELSPVPGKKRMPSRRALWEHFKSGSKFFQVFFYSKIFTSSGVFFTGIFFGNVTAGYYSAVEKMILLFKNMLAPLPQALFPFFAKKADAGESIKRYLRFVPMAAMVFAAVTVALYILAEPVVQFLFGSKFSEAAGILRLLSPVFIIAGIYILTGYHVFLSMNNDRQYIMTVAVPAVLFVSLTPAVLTIHNSLDTFLVAILLSESLVLVLRLYFLFRVKPRV